MLDEKIIKFFEGVLSKTKDAKIAWGPTAQESSFIAAIGGQFTLSISSGAEDAVNKSPALYRLLEKYALILRDMLGRIATITDKDEGEAGIPSGAMRELFEMARWQAVHGGEKINKAIEVLQTL
jgi:hypothetical protein